jgi:hypothetical protein
MHIRITSVKLKIKLKNNVNLTLINKSSWRTKTISITGKSMIF